ncbi:MAG TPA: hypothetical protein VF645_10980 [Allosphingosinicella sp.]|jgi:hypothetical protein
MDKGPYSWRSDPDVPAFPDAHPLILFDGLTSFRPKPESTNTAE